MIKITAETVKPEEQRYKTCGDWVFSGQELNVKVIECGTVGYEFLLAIHEMVEAYLCAAHGISGRRVDNWDLAHIDDPEPGEMTKCPYRREHEIATIIERILAHELGISWSEYDETIERLMK